MQYIKQNGYDEFCCLADKCERSCCMGWQIVVDEDSLIRYSSHDGEMAEDYLRGIDFDEGVFRLRGDRCYFLEDSGLCRMQRLQGEGELCHTCRTYPRHTEEYEGIRELSLSLSCPVVAREVITSGEFIHFTESEDDTEDDFEEFDYLLYTKLIDSREYIYSVIKSTDISLNTRMKMILDFSGKIQNLVDEEKIFDMDDIIEKAVKDLNDVPSAHSVDFDFRDKTCFDILFKLEVLQQDFRNREEKTWNSFFDKAEDDNIVLDFSEYEEKAAERILYSLIFTYFCGSVYDEMIFSKAAMCVYMVRWIILISRTQRDYNPQSEECLDAIYRITYLLAREIEHSDENLIALDDFFDSLGGI